MNRQHALSWFFCLAGAVVGGELVAATLLRGAFPLGGFLIFSAMLLCFWFLAHSGKVSWTGLVAGAVLVVLCSSATLFDWWRFSLGGVTFDTYVHLVAAFVTTLLLLEALGERKHGTLIALGTILVLSIGVEAVELADEFWINRSLLTPDCASSFCEYWQDTVKDLFNDALGAWFAFLGFRATWRGGVLEERRRRRRVGVKEKRA